MPEPTDPRRTYVLPLHLHLSAPDNTLMANAAELGRRSGRGDDWTPDSLDAALTEIVLMSDAPADLGVEI